MLETAIAKLETPTTDTDGVWIEALPARIYHTPQYGKVPIPVDKLQRMITNFKTNVRGQDIATDFEHGIDPAKGKQASGWYKDFDIRPSTDDPNQQSLWAHVQLTEEAKADVKAGKWKYWSLEWDDEYETDTGAIVPDVVIGGGLTNRPVAKRTMPINFSEEMWNELDADTQKQFAVWSTAYVNKLPDSAFLFTDSNGRHLPYKDASGKIDLPHLRNAAARVNQIKGISADKVASIRARIQKLLAGASKASELMMNMPENVDEPTKQWIRDSFMLFNESAAWEHSDPGIGAPLYSGAQGQPDPGFALMIPRQPGNPAANDPAIGGGWRWEPLAAGDPSTADELTKPELREPSGRDKTFAENDDVAYLTSALNALESYLTDETLEKDQKDVQTCQALVAKIKGLLSSEQAEPDTDEMAAQVQAATSFAEQHNITINAPKGGKTVEFTEENVTELRSLLAIPDDADSDKFMESARNAFSELKTFKDTVGQSQQEKQFSEQFPAVWAEHQALLESNRVGSARAFAESVQRLTTPKGEGDNITFEPTRNGLSALALDTVADVHKKFSEGTATMEDFEGVIKTITNGGIVEFGEVGSSHEKDLPVIDVTTATGIQNTRRAFAEKVAEVQESNPDKFGGQDKYGAAVAEAGRLYPDLAAAYRATAA